MASSSVFDGLTRKLRFKPETNELALQAFGKETKRTSATAQISNNFDSDDDEKLDFFGTRARTKKIKKKKQATNKKEAPQVTQDVDEVPATTTAADEEEASQLRKRLRIKVKGSDVPMPMVSFTERGFLLSRKSKNHKKSVLHVASLLKKNVDLSTYVEPTAVQMQAVPAMLLGRDVLTCAPTGSGKTAAFLLPLVMKLVRLEKKSSGIKSLIIVPTRELAAQILREFEKLTAGKHFRACVLKKASSNNVSTGSSSEGKGFDLVVTTPLRLVKLIQENAIRLDSVKVLILDEADKLFDMGFLAQIDEIIAACNSSKIQRGLFSATIPPQIEQLAHTILRDPLEITVGVQNSGAETIEQKLTFVGQEEGKLMAIRQFIQAGELVPPTLIFVQSKERAQELYRELVYDGIKVEVMHSERTQAQRDKLVKGFRRGDIWCLICTELMARGIDFKGVNCVVNYDMPTSAVSYIHRIGRTGRANRKGKAITLFTLEDVDYLRPIANVVKLSGCEVPDWMLKIKKMSSKEKRKLEKRPIERKTISTMSSFDKKRMEKKRNIIKHSKERQQRKKSKKTDN